MVLAMDPAVEAGLRLSAMAQATRRGNARLGADGLCVTAAGLSLGHDDLVAATEAYLAAYGSRAEPAARDG